jgi:hypothetical protein
MAVHLATTINTPPESKTSPHKVRICAHKSRRRRRPPPSIRDLQSDGKSGRCERRVDRAYHRQELHCETSGAWREGCGLAGGANGKAVLAGGIIGGYFEAGGGNTPG